MEKVRERKFCMIELNQSFNHYEHPQNHSSANGGNYLRKRPAKEKEKQLNRG